MSQPIDDRAQERRASVVMLVAIGAILLLGTPCFCYFGAGLVMGLDQSGRYKNPVRQKKERYIRKDEYRRSFDKSRPARPDRYNRKFEK